jgi:hypothetical protein
MQILTGTANIFQHYDPPQYMWTGHGAREVTKVITFSDPFGAPPGVVASISALDGSNQANMRVAVECVGISATQFTAKVTTWFDTKLALVNITWVAIG